MARRNMILDDKLEERVKKYCEQNGITFTTFTHMALDHYLNHIELSKSITSVFKDYLTKSVSTEE